MRRFGLIALLIVGCIGAEKPAKVAPYRCAFTSIAPTIDGKIDDEAWNNANWTADFVDVTTGEKAPLRTRAKLLWDTENLYVAAELEEPNVRGKRTEHDDKLYMENAFEVFLDPELNGINYFEFEINALGTTFDLVMDKEPAKHGKGDLSWEAQGWKTAVHVGGTINDPSDRDRGWTVEMAIPWAALQKLHPNLIPPKPGARWRFELSRVNGLDDPKGYWVTSPTGAINFHVPDRWGQFEFVH